MNSNRFIAPCVLLLFFCSMDTALATDYVIGLPRAIPSAAARTSLGEHIDRFIQNDMKTGDTLRIFDAFNIRGVSTLSIPKKKAFEYPKVRRKQFRRQIKLIKDHIRGLGTHNTQQSAVLLPQFLEHLSVHVFDQRQGEAPINVLVFGNALYMDERENAFSMREGWFPSDGHLKVSQRHSIYGTVKKRDRLKHFSIHILHTNRPETWYNDLYQHRIHRFWGLFIKTQAGVLLTFTQDVGSAFDRFAKTGLRPNEEFEFDHTADKVEMLRAWRDAVPTITSPLSTPETASPEPVLHEDTDALGFLKEGIELSVDPPSVARGKLKLGIRWSCNRCDIDLHARASDDEPFLNFSHVETGEGKYFKDFTSSPDTINGLEHIEFTKDVDVNDLQVLVNFYSGRIEGGPKGVVRVFFDGRVYEGPFHIQASKGNRGLVVDSAEPSHSWSRIDMASILGLK